MKWRGRRVSTNVIDLRNVKQILIDYVNAESPDFVEFISNVDMVILLDGSIDIQSPTVGKNFVVIGIIPPGIEVINSEQKKTLRQVLGVINNRDVMYQIESPVGELKDMAIAMLLNKGL